MAAPRLSVDQRERVIAFELGHLGMHEQPMGSNNTEPGKWYGTNGLAWCAAFQSWSFYSTLGFSPFPASTKKGFAACAAGAAWFRRQGAWAPASAVPQRGWPIFFIWTPGDIEHHIGLVLGAGGPRNVDTVEGNTSDKVALHHRSGSTIAGYGIINYVDDAPALPATPRLKPTPVLRQTLHPGARGDVVFYEQTMLRFYAARYHRPDVDPGEPDGEYGTHTGQAVLAYKGHTFDLEHGFGRPLTFHKPFSNDIGTAMFQSLDAYCRMK